MKNVRLANRDLNEELFRNSLVDRREAQLLLGVAKTRFYQLIAEGVIPSAVKLGGRTRRYPVAGILEAIERLKADQEAGNGTEE